MNHDVQRSSNVLIDETPSAGRWVQWAIGRSQRAFRLREEEQVHSKTELRAEERRRRSDSLSKRSLSPAWNIIHRVIDEVRIVLQGLRSPFVPSTMLERALSEFMGEIVPVAGPRLRIVVTGQPRTLTWVVQEQIYLIGREALVNALRHSEATSIEAEIEYSRRRMRVVVRDDGCGIDQEVLTSERNPHHGLRGMLERAEAVGARLKIWSKRGSGTEVELSLRF